MKKFVIQCIKFELKMSYINEVMNFLICQNFQDFYFDFSGFISLKIAKKGLFNCAGPVEVTWRDTYTWRGHESPRGCLRGAYVA